MNFKLKNNMVLLFSLCVMTSYAFASTSAMFTNEDHQIFTHGSEQLMTQLKPCIDQYKQFDRVNYVGNLDILYQQQIVNNLKTARKAMAHKAAMASMQRLESRFSSSSEDEIMQDPQLFAASKAFVQRELFGLDRTNRTVLDDSRSKKGQLVCEYTGVTPALDVEIHAQLMQSLEDILGQYANQSKGMLITNGNTKLTIRRITDLTSYDYTDPSWSDDIFSRLEILGQKKGGIATLLGQKQYLKIRNDYIFAAQLSKYAMHLAHGSAPKGLMEYESKCLLRIDISTSFDFKKNDDPLKEYIPTGAIATVLGMDPLTGNIDIASLPCSLFLIEHTIHTNIESIMSHVYNDWSRCMLCPLDASVESEKLVQMAVFSSHLARMFYAHSVAMPYHRGSEAILKWLVELTAYARNLKVVYPEGFSMRKPFTSQTFASFIREFQDAVTFESLSFEPLLPCPMLPKANFCS